MNRSATPAVESKLNPATSDAHRKERQRRAIFAAKDRQQDPDALSWLEEDQMDAEMEFLVSEMANKGHREYRRSLSR
jgi:hypothetical protein